jgi:hypothetical protein
MALACIGKEGAPVQSQLINAAGGTFLIEPNWFIQSELV